MSINKELAQYQLEQAKKSTVDSLKLAFIEEALKYDPECQEALALKEDIFKKQAHKKKLMLVIPVSIVLAIIIVVIGFYLFKQWQISENYKKGVSATQNGQFKQALIYFKKVKKANPKYSKLPEAMKELYYQWGLSLFKNGDYEKALQALNFVGDYKDAKDKVKEINPINTIGMEFVLIPAGTFTMGSNDGSSNEKPPHTVTISKPFYIGKYEVTQAQWVAVMGSNPSNFKGDNLPVESVSWNDVQEFIRKLNAVETHLSASYRLPTEAEWEYACRAGTTTHFAFGNCLSADDANYDGNYPLSGCSKGVYRRKTMPVGSFRANAFGLYDMHGNVWEWCQDWYGENYYASSPSTDPQGPSTGSYRVLRGGSWYNLANPCRSAFRDSYLPDFRLNNVGFRVARAK